MTIHRGEPLHIPPDGLPRSVVEVVHRSVARNENRVALRWKTDAGWASWTYAELWEQIAAASIGLGRLGVGSGDRVVVLSRSRPEWLVADLACQALGAVTCPLYPGDPPARMAAMVRSLDARLFLVEDARLLGRLRAGTEDAPLPGPVVLFDAEPGDGLPSLAGVAASAPAAPGAPERAAWDAAWRAVGPEDVATIVHTIGTDGVPLGVDVGQVVGREFALRPPGRLAGNLGQPRLLGRCPGVDCDARLPDVLFGPDARP